MSAFSFHGRKLSETFHRVLQITSGNTLLDGSGDTRSLYVNGNFSADTIFIGGSNLYDIFSQVDTGNTTLVQDGLNTFTGGTILRPTVNITGGTFHSLNVTGSSVFNTTNTGTIFSAGTDLSLIFASIGSVGGSTFLPTNQIAFGNSLSGLTGNSRFTFIGTGNTSTLSVFSPNLSNYLNVYSDDADSYLQGGSGNLNIAGTNVRIRGNGAQLRIEADNTGNINLLTNSVSRLTVDGTDGIVRANSLSAITFSAGTINSGSTNLYQIFATTGSTYLPTQEIAFGSSNSGLTSSAGLLWNDSINLMSFGNMYAGHMAGGVAGIQSTTTNLGLYAQSSASYMFIQNDGNIRATSTEFSNTGGFRGSYLSATTISGNTIRLNSATIDAVSMSIDGLNGMYFQTNLGGNPIYSQLSLGADRIRLVSAPTESIFVTNQDLRIQAGSSSEHKLYLNANEIISNAPTRITSLSATTFSASTINSGSTDLSLLFTPIGGIATASNVGVGNAIFKQKSGHDLEFRTLSAGTNVTITTGDTITIHATLPSGSGDMAKTENLSGLTDYQTARNNLGLGDLEYRTDTPKKFKEFIYSGENLSRINIWVDDTKVVKLYQTDFSYLEGNLTASTVTRITDNYIYRKVFEYDVDGNIETIDVNIL